MNNIIDGKKIANKIEAQLKKEISNLKTKPKLAVVLVGDDSPSQVYVKRKKEAAERVGIVFSLFHFKKDITEKKLITEIKNIQTKFKPNGLIVQLPLPEHLYAPEVLNAIDPKIDVDCLTDINQGKLLMEKPFVEPPTPLAVIAILEDLKINLKGKNIVIIGTGVLVGKPLSAMLMNRGATVIGCNSQTKNIKQKCLDAEIIITAVGKKNILTADMVKKDVVIIDAGIAMRNKKTVGDVDFKNVSKKAKYITPVPGGVGPITVIELLSNTIKLSK